MPTVANVTSGTEWWWRGIQGHDLMLCGAGRQFYPSLADLVDFPVPLFSWVWHGTFKDFQKVGQRQSHLRSIFFPQLGKRTGLEPPLCILRAAPWDKVHSVISLRLPLLHLSLCSKPIPPVVWKSKCVFTLPLSLWQVNKEKHLLGERTELSVKNPKHPSRKSQTALKSETKTTKSWQRGASISSNPHLSF